MDMKMSTALRRAKTPYSPITKRAALKSWKYTRGTMGYTSSAPDRAITMAPIKATSNTNEAISNGIAHRVNK